MKSPFKFLDSFTKEDREIFYGREKEIEELYRRVFRGKIMLVYGVSGTGKSSLINCGLANKFRDEDWLPVNVRRGSNILESMYASIVAASLTTRSQYQPTEAQFRKHVKSLYLDHYKPVYFIFDQFEELFIFGSREEKSLFVRVIKNLVDSDILCRFIFVMREEYMANVTEFEKHIPVFFSNRVRIENMDINNAIQAIKGPCKVFNINVEEGFPETLIENLSPGSPDIELTYLQVFLDKVYRLSLDSGETEKEENRNISFTLDVLKKIGNVSDLLGSFLNEQISLLDDPDTALAVLKSFVSIKGTKKQMTLDEVKEYSHTLGKPVKEPVLLEMLQNFVHLRILRDKDQHERYELRHDSLATKIFEKISVVEKDILEIRQFIEDGYHNWQKRGVLFSGNDLDYIAPYESRIFISPELLNFITQSKNQLEKVKQKRRAVFIASTFILLIAFAGFTVWAMIERNSARKQEIVANANYYNALSKELMTVDPTKAFRLAGYACELFPSENNYQNLVNIYSGNEFYFPYHPARNYIVSNFKILDQSGNIALIESNKLKIIDSQGVIINESDFNLPQYSNFDVSPDGNYFLIFTLQDTLKVYDNQWNVISKIYLKDYYTDNATFVSDSEIVITAVSRNTESGKILHWSLNGKLTETKESFDYGFVVPRNSPDTIYFIIQNRGSLFTWIPGKNNLTEKVLRLTPPEVVRRGQFISTDKIALLTNYDSIKISNLEGRIQKSWCAADEENRSFYRLYFIDEMNLLCAQNNKVVKFWDLNGQNITNLKLDGSSVIKLQFNKFSNEVLILINNQIISYKPVNLNNELIVKKAGNEYQYSTFENCFIESSGSGKQINVLSINGDDLEKTALSISEDKHYFSFPGNNSVYINFPDSFNYNGKHKAIIYDLNGNPLVQFKDSIGYPNRIFFSQDGNLVAVSGQRLTQNRLVFYNSAGFRLYNRSGEHIKDYLVMATNGKISHDNKNFLSRSGKTIILNDTSGKQLTRYSGQKGYITGYDLSMDNNYLLSSADDKTIRLWSRDGKLLKVIQTENEYVQATFLPGQRIFQVVGNTSVKLYNTDGVMIQEIPSSQGHPVVASPDGRFLYYIGNEGLHRTIMKIPVDSFIISNNYNDFSFIEKMEYNMITVNDLMESKNPYYVYQAGKYYLDNISKKTDVSEIKNSIKISEKLFKKVLLFDTLHVPVASRLTELYIEKSQYFKVNLKKEIEKFYKIMVKSNNQDDLLNALDFYGATVQSGNLDSTELSYGYYDKVISIGNLLMKMFPGNNSVGQDISFKCSNISFGLLDYKLYEKSLAAVKLAIEADSTNQYSYTNLPLAYLFNNMFDQAVIVYKKWMDKPWTETPEYKTFRQVFLLDIRDLESRGITHPDFEKVKELLKE